MITVSCRSGVATLATKPVHLQSSILYVWIPRFHFCIRVHHGSMGKNSLTRFELSGFSLCVVMCKGKKWQIFFKSKDI